MRWRDYLMKTLLLTKVTVALFLFPACREPAEKSDLSSLPELTPEERAEYLEKGKDAIRDLATTLEARLKAAIAEGGPVAAVGVCQEVAQPLTEAVGAAREGVTITRTSLKYRNPQNAPDALDRKVLESWQDQLTRGEPLPELDLHESGNGRIRVYKPIMLQPVCLNCHGPDEQLLPDLKTLLDELYPEDRARGFQVGDLRGGFRVEIETGTTK